MSNHVGKTLVIGLTGGVCSGKSSAARVLGSLGAAVIDADKLGHHAYKKGSKGHRRVIAAFGKEVVDKESNEIDRRALGSIVFGDEKQMKKLTSIVWPIIRSLAYDEIEKMKANKDTKVIVVEAAVMIEAKWTDLFDEIWLCTVPVDVAKARLMERNQLSEKDALSRINAQLSNEQRIPYADIVIDTNREQTKTQSILRKHWQQTIAKL